MISIHALCEEGDLNAVSYLQAHDYFYPRPLRGGRRAPSFRAAHLCWISIHALCEEGDVRRPCGQS